MISFKSFLKLFKGEPKPEKPKTVMTVDSDQVEFERDLLARELKKHSIKAVAHKWNGIAGQIGPFQWGALFGGIDEDNDLWQLRYVDTREKVQQEIEVRSEMQATELVQALKSLKNFADRLEAKK